MARALRLRSIAGQQRGQEFVFSGPRVRIGRSRDNDLILPDRDNPASSSHHAEALLDATGAWWIVDAGSSNGTRVNDVAVTRHKLENGARLTLGDEQFIIALVGAGRRRWLLGASAVAVALGLVAAFEVVERQSPPFERVAATAARSVFLIAIEEGNSRSIVGTGFAISADGWIATNAHVAAELQRRGAIPAASGAARAIAVQGDSYGVRRIVSAVISPEWQPGTLHKDVALLRVENGTPLVPLKLATAAALAKISRGTPVAAFGFPAVSTDAAKPRGRLSVDVVGDVRGEYLEVGLGIAPGTSGSPIFDQSGIVVGIVAGGDFVGGPEGQPRPTGTSANWALSASVVSDLLAAQ